jgi:hypothetical protein
MFQYLVKNVGWIFLMIGSIIFGVVHSKQVVKGPKNGSIIFARTRLV